MMHHEENPIENMEDSELDPIVYIGSLLGATKDGKLTLTYYPDDGTEEYTQTYTMDWTEEDAVAVAHRYYDLQSALDQIGLMHEQLTDRSQAEKLLSPEQMTVWETYIAPFEDHCFDQEAIFDIQMKEEYEVLTEEEFALLEEYWEWYEQQCLQRLPYNRRSSAELINRARRYERLVSLRAPKIVLNNEALRLAEEMVLYCCMAEHSHNCRCCGSTYMPEELIVDGSVCPVCDWQEDGTAETDYSYFNGASLQDYCKEYHAKSSAKNGNN